MGGRCFDARIKCSSPHWATIFYTLAQRSTSPTGCNNTLIMLIHKYFFNVNKPKNAIISNIYKYGRIILFKIKTAPNLHVSNKIAKFAPLMVKQVKRLAFTPTATGCSQLRSFSILPIHKYIISSKNE